MKKIVFLAFLLLLLMGCGDKSLLTTIPQEGIRVSYNPAVGKTLSYINETDNITDIAQTGSTQSTHEKSTAKIDFLILESNEKSTGIKYTFVDIQSGTFTDGGFVPESRPMADQAPGCPEIYFGKIRTASFR